jgi:hypothetical protein
MTLKNTKRFDDVRPGEALPELAIPITVGLITGGPLRPVTTFPAITTWTRPASLARPISS